MPKRPYSNWWPNLRRARLGNGCWLLMTGFWLPEIERFYCTDFAVGESFELLHDFDKAMYYRTKWARELTQSKRADTKRKLTTMGRARSLWG